MKTVRFHFLWVSLILVALAMLCPQTVSAAGATSTEINNAIVQEGSIPLTWVNDATYPWTISNGKLQNGNVGKANSTSKVSLKYNSSYPTALTFKYDVTGNSGTNRFHVYVDGDRKIDDYSETGKNVTYRLPVGNHTIEFRDTVYNTTTNYYSRLYDVKVTEYPGASIQEINNTIVQEGSVPLEWKQDSNYPWRIVNGKLENGNWGFANSTSKVSFKYSSAYPTTLSFKFDVTSGGSNHFQVYVDGDKRIDDYSENGKNVTYRLPLGNHTIEFRDTVYNTTSNYYGRLYDVKVTEYPGASIQEINDAIVQEGSIPLEWEQDSNYPWRIVNGKLENGNWGFANSASKVSFKYSSAYPSTLSFKFDVTSGGSNHFQVYVDGDKRIDDYSENGKNVTYRFLKGDHTIEFVDTVDNSTYYYYGRIYDVKVAEFSGATDEDYNKIISRSDVPLTWTNDENFPWGFENERFQNSNAQYSNTQSSLKTTFTIDKPTKIGFKHRVGYNSGSADHILRFFVDGEEYLSNSQTTSFSTYYTVLTPGTYTLEWRYDNKTAGNNYYAEIKDLEITQDWITVDITPGMLGVETLYKVNVLQDVKMIKINGQLNSTDWNVLKQMSGMYAVDLSGATIGNIPNDFFKNQTRIKYVKLPEGLETINASSFYGTGLNEIEIPSTVTSIGNEAFRNSTLRNITFAENSQLNTIGENAFYECSLLKEFSMPNSVKSIGSYMFFRCGNLQKLVFSDGLTSLPEYTCYENNSLAEIHFPSNLVSIGRSFMYGANSLKELNLPMTMRSIGSEAFAELRTLKHLIIPEKLNSLGEYAFYNSDGLEIVELPSGVSTYDRTFQGCGGIKKIVCRAATPPAVPNDAFNSVTKANVTLEVPSFAVASYKLDSYWYKFGNIIEGDPVDYWKIIGDLKLLNNRRMEGKPDIDLYYNGKLTVGGDAAMPIGKFDIYTSDGNASSLVTDCPNITADEINTIYHVDANKWYFITPMVDVDLRQVNVTGTPNYVFRYYDGATRADIGAGTSWKNVSDMTLKSGVGYIFQCNAASDVIFPVPVNMHSRVLTTEAVTLPLTAHPSDNAANKGWNYVGNPFPSYYDIYYMDFTAPITVWTGSTYRAYSITDDNFVLRPMQGFFVQKPDAIDVITLQPAGRQIQSTVNRSQKSMMSRADVKSEDSRSVFNLEISKDTVSDVTRIVLNNNASAGYEIERDASKFMSMDETVPQIYSIDADNNHLAINERPESNGEIPLGIYIPIQTETYSIRCTRQDGEAYLYDAELNVTHNLANGEYRFSASNGIVENRFSIRLKSDAISGITDISGENANIVIQSMPDGIEVSNLANSNITVYGLDGKVLYAKTSLNGTSFIPLAKGLYVVNVDGSSYKVLVK